MSPLPDARGAATQPFATRKVFFLVPPNFHQVGSDNRVQLLHGE